LIWFKHDTDAITDAKIKKLILKFGAEGYAIYFHCLELIAGDVNENNITFSLEHDAEIISDNLKIKSDVNECAIDKVNRIMLYIIELGLFESNNNYTTCMKLAKRLDQSMTSSPRFRKMIDSVKSHDKIMMSHDVVMLEEKRKDNNIKEIDKDIKIYYNCDYFALTDVMIKDYKKTYTKINIDEELNKMKLWLDANPTKRKTERGYPRFVNSWLSRAYETAKSKPIQINENPIISEKVNLYVEHEEFEV